MVLIEENIVDALNEYDVGLKVQYSPYYRDPNPLNTITIGRAFISTNGHPVVRIDRVKGPVHISHLIIPICSEEK